MAKRCHGALGEVGDFDGLRLGEVGVVGHMPVWHDYEVPAVVRVGIQHRVDLRATRPDQAVRIAQLRYLAERALNRVLLITKNLLLLINF